jgi:FkbM family methyltransferase
MNKDILLKRLNTVEMLASSRWRRLLHHPFRYVYAVFFAKFIYPKTKREIRRDAPLFYSETMKVDLPAATDIYLTGGKSHASEIRLARFLILNLSPGSRFLDIGAHYGYFSLLASKITGATGKVFAFEPADKSFALLRENSARRANITSFKKAVSDTAGMLTFFQFPTLYSEYNSMNAEQFSNEAWFPEFKPVTVEVPATTIDAITEGESFVPDLIKMDVEGAEYKAMLGGVRFFQSHAPVLVMEYLNPARQNEEHKKAVSLLRELGYLSYAIRHSGEIDCIDDIDEYLTVHRLDSDNIVFKKHPMP